MKCGDLSAGCRLAENIVLEWIDASRDAVRTDSERSGSPVRPDGHSGRSRPMPGYGDPAPGGHAAILSRLGDLHPEAALLGDGTPRNRAEVMAWLGFLATEVCEALLPIPDASAFRREGAWAEIPAEDARSRVRAHLEQIDAQLAGRTWLVGARSVADALLFVILRWAADMDISLSGLRHLMQYARRVEDDPGVQAAVLAAEGASAAVEPATVRPRIASSRS